MLRRLKQLVGSYRGRLAAIDERLDVMQAALGRIEARQTESVPAGDLQRAEFKVTSQWGEDGILEHLLRHVPITRDVFVEFGVQDYREANTRFLLQNRNWSGLVLDGSPENIAAIKRDPLYWRYNLKAECAFITRDNIESLISGQGVSGDIGLLSVDIDGNDYWVWQAIKEIAPRIVVTEYNAIFGPSAAVSVPYAADFRRTQAHYSNLYWGCSLAALAHLGREKGYVLIGCNSAGNNAFFVRRDVAGPFKEKDPATAFRPSKFRESRDRDGNLSFLSRADAIRLIGDLPLVDVRDGKELKVDDLKDLQ